MRKLLALLGLLAFAPFAHAQTASLSWTAVTQGTEGSNSVALIPPVTYNVYQQLQPTSGACTTASMTKVQSAVTATAATITTGLTAGTTQCFAVTAVASGVEGAFSNIASAAIPFPTPLAPSQVTVVIH